MSKLIEGLRTSDFVPDVLRARRSHSSLRSARVREAYRVVLSELLAGCAEKAPVMCKRRRQYSVVADGLCCDRARRARNEVDRGAAIGGE